MSTDFSKDAFFKFLNYLSDKNLVKFQTVRGWRSAATKLFTDLSEAEEADIRIVDLDLAVHRALNRDSDSLTPQSFKTYQQRVAIAISEFEKWRSDPSGYKPRGLNGQVRKNGESSRQTPANPSRSAAPEKLGKDSHISTGLTLAYPLRADFLAQVVIPRDLNIAEAKRLGAFLLTIAVDYKPE